MIQEYEGKTEKEAIEKAIADLGLTREEFDVEIQENSTKGLFFKKGNVKIRVHVSDDKMYSDSVQPEDEFEIEIVKFVSKLLEYMGCPAEITIKFRDDSKIGLDIHTESSGIIIGKKGKTLDSLQLLVNNYANKIGEESTRIILDVEHYRDRREESIRRLAKKTADYVRKTRGSKLLAMMNPFERRLIHTTLNNYDDVDTKSEGEGTFKQVRVMYRG